MLVGDAVVGDDIRRRALGQVLVGRVAGVEAVAAVGVDRQAGHRRVQAVAQHGGVISVAVVASHAAGDDGVFVATVAVGHRHRLVVGARQRDRQRRRGRCARQVCHGVGNGRRRALSGAKVLKRAARIEGVGAIGMDHEATAVVAGNRAACHRRRSAVRDPGDMQHVKVVGVRIVRQHIACDGRAILARALAVICRHRTGVIQNNLVGLPVADLQVEG